MKKSKIIIFLIILTFILLIPVTSRAYNNYDFYCKNDAETCYYGPNYKSITGIWHQRLKDPDKWIESKIDKGNNKFSSEWRSSKLPEAKGKSLINGLGGVCFGHKKTDNGKTGYMSIGMALDMDDNSTYEEKLLAYIILKSTEANETTNKEALYKKKIRLWLHDNYHKYGGVTQPIDDATSPYEYEESKEYAKSLEGEAFKTNSTEGENATQQIIYNNGNTYIGPYHLETSIGNLTEAIVTTREGVEYTTKKYSTNATNYADISKVSSYNGKTFYIVIEGKQIDSVSKIVLKKQYNYIRARMIAADNKNMKGQNLGIYYGKWQTKPKEISLPGVPYSKIKIKKIDEITGKPLANIGLVLRNTQYGYVKTGTPVTFVNKIEEATIFNTDKNGYIEIKNITKKGTFDILEVINPYMGYEEVSIDNPLKVSSATINSVGNNIDMTVTNKKVYIKLSGYAWEDIANQVERNNLWNNDNSDSKDKRLNNVKVTLKDKDGNILESKLTKTITNSSGNQEDGAYILGDYKNDPKAARIKIEDLDKLYIEFEYNGMCYQSVNVNTLTSNGSKATDEKSRDRFNEEYAVIINNQAQNIKNQNTHKLTYDMNNNKSTINYGGKYAYGYDNQRYPVSGVDSQYLITANTLDAEPNKILGQNITKEEIYKNEISEIKNINLGIYEREMPDIALTEDLCTVKVKFVNSENNHNYDYQHTYKYEQVKKSYQREMYTSDIMYGENHPGNLQIYLTYKITLKNDSSVLNTLINKLESYLNSDYEVINIKDQSNNNITSNIENEFKNNYKKVTIDVKQALLPGEQKNIYMELKLKNPELKNILEGTKKINLVTEISSYSTYQDKTFKNSYAGIDKDSNPGSTVPSNNNTYEDDTDLVSLDLVKKEGRTTKGTIWEDTAIQNLLNNQNAYERQRKGDGKYIKGENVVKNVKVELLDSETKETVKLYTDNPNGTLAQTTTNSKGEYSFTGIIPGKYLIRYTYGDTSIICDSSGNEKEKIKPINYKSTVYRNGEKEKAENMTDYWYKDETGTSSIRLSDAKDNVGIYQDGRKVDIVEERTTDSGDIKYDTAKKEDGLKEIQADTRKFDIKIESGEEISNFGQTFNASFDNIDFGIIERARQDLTITKEVAYISVSLSSGQVIVEGDPRREQIDYVKFLPDGNVSIELEEEILQSAYIKVKYEVKVSNKKSEIDYNSKDYYIYGKIPANYRDWRIATVSKLFDYLSNDLTFDDNEELNKVWKDVKISKENLVDTGRLSEEAYKYVKRYNRIFETSAFKDMAPDTEKSIYLVATRLLANTDEEFDLRNDVEVNELKFKKIQNSIPGNYVPSDANTYEKDNSHKEIIITTPTGQNKNYLPYITLGISVFGILIAGILIIKKKVL